MNLLIFGRHGRKPVRKHTKKEETVLKHSAYRAWIQNALGIDAWNWNVLDTTSPDQKTTDLVVYLNDNLGTAASFVVNSEEADLLERMYRKQKEAGYPYHEDSSFHLMFSVCNTMVSLFPAK